MGVSTTGIESISYGGGAGAGGGLGTRQPFVWVRKNTSQTINSLTDTPVKFDSADVEKYDALGFHNPLTNSSQFKVPIGWAGIYVITSQVTWAANATGIRQVHIRKNGIDTTDESYNGMYQVVGGNILNRLPSACLLFLDEGDFVELMVYLTGPASLPILGHNTAPGTPTYLQMCRLNEGPYV